MNNKVNFLRGTAAEYEASTKDSDVFYYTTDTKKLYLGETEITSIEIDDASTTATDKTWSAKKISEHTNNADIHVTDEEKAAWNAVNYSNPNLLDNPDFKINQRGESEYTGTASGIGKYIYCVDRWLIFLGTSSTEGSVVITPNSLGGMTISNQTNNIGALIQKIEKYTDLFGKQVTFSANIDGKILSTTATIVNLTGEIGTLSTDFGFLRFYVKENTFVDVEIWINASKSITVNWAKLEIGSIATPFCPSNPATELAKCQRYFNSLFMNGIPVKFIGSGIAVTDNMATILVNLPTVMRSSAPTVSLTGTLYLSDGSHVAENSIAMQGIAGSHLNQNVLQLNLTSGSTLDRTATYLLSRRDTDTTLTVSAEL